MRVRPPGSEKLLLGDELPTIFDQATEDRERLRREGHHLALVQEPLVGEIQGVAFERQEPMSVHRRAGNRFLTGFFHRRRNRLWNSVARFDLVACRPDLLCEPDSGLKNRRVFLPCLACKVHHRPNLPLLEAIAGPPHAFFVALVKRALSIIAMPPHLSRCRYVAITPLRTCRACSGWLYPEQGLIERPCERRSRI